MRLLQSVFDYGAAGVAHLTVDHTGSSSFPIPAAKHGVAQLIRGSEAHDRLAICTRTLTPDQLRAMLADRVKRPGPADIAERARRWGEQHAGTEFLEMPTQARPLGRGAMMLGFGGLTEPKLLRLVDFVQGRILWERTIQSLVEECGIKAPSWLGLFGDSMMLEANGSDHLMVFVRAARLALIRRGDVMEPARWSLDEKESPDYFGTVGQFIVQRSRERNEYGVLDPATGRQLSTFASAVRPKAWTAPATNPANPLVILSHNGGDVEVFEGPGKPGPVIRPYPRVGRNDANGAVASHSGRWLGVRAWETFRVVDLENLLVAEIRAPVPNMTDAEHVLYDSDVAATDLGIAIADFGTLEFVGYGKLDWQPVTQPGRAPRKAVGVDKWLAKWRRPALAIEPGRTGRSQLYGAPRMAPEDIPRHSGRPMQLLACIDLAEAAEAIPDNPWPREGVLHFFVALDEEGALLEDEHFHPVAHRVVWSRKPMQGEGEADRAAQPASLVRHRADLPDLTSAIVECSGIDDAALEAYRTYLDKEGIADQPNGHRLGGYPTILQNNDLEAQAAVKAGDLDDYPRDRAQMAKAASWRLLLQLDSDDEFMWGTDSGTLYFLVHDDDLARGDFSRVVAITEGY